MKEYVERALKQLQYSTPTKHHFGPKKYVPPEYGKKMQYSTEDISPELTPLQKDHIQKVCGQFLYDGRSVNSTQLHALNKLSIKTIPATEETQEALIQCLNYCASNPNATIIYRASDMIVSYNSYVAYLVAPKSQNRVGGQCSNRISSRSRGWRIIHEHTRIISNENNIRRTRPSTTTNTNTNR